jgi:hypothetical protein
MQLMSHCQYALMLPETIDASGVTVLLSMAALRKEHDSCDCRRLL